MTDHDQTADQAPAGPAAAEDAPRHLAPDDAADRPLIDLSRDPTPGVPDHAAPEDE